MLHCIILQSCIEIKYFECASHLKKLLVHAAHVDGNLLNYATCTTAVLHRLHYPPCRPHLQGEILGERERGSPADAV